MVAAANDQKAEFLNTLLSCGVRQGIVPANVEKREAALLALSR
jgi:hypothetical protein